MNGLFYHDWITESADDDILDLELTETSEFVDKCPSMNPTVHFDAFNSGNRTISVPGGYKETPSGKPYDLNSVPVPGNNGEKPTGRPYDETSIKSGNKIELTDSEYNDALVALQKSFKESMDIIGALTNSKRVDKTNAQILDEAYDQAFLDAAINGAMFEKVGRADKDTVKEIVSKIQPDLFNWIKEQGFKAYKPVRFGRWMINSSNNMLWSTWWSTRMWQVLGCAILNDEDYRQFTKFVNEKYKDELGGYKIIVQKCTPSFIDLFRGKFNIKNQLMPYFMFVDKGLDMELKKIVQEDTGAGNPQDPEFAKNPIKKY